MNRVILALPDNEQIADRLASRLGIEVGEITMRRFPDEETYVRIDAPVSGNEVILVCTLHRPDDKILPLLFLAATAKDMGATRVGLVAPYLAYMRQDRRFQPGEGITSAYFATLLSGSVDWLVTVDPHLHRRRSLAEIYSVPSKAVHAAPLISDWIRSNIEAPVLVGPDSESAQWVKAVADGAGAPYVILEKVRRGDRDVKVSVPDVEGCHNRTPVLVDDIISTARTMIETIRHLKSAGLKAPVCVGVHAVFTDKSYRDLLTAGAAQVVTSNTIPHVSNVIDVSSLLSQAVVGLAPPKSPEC